MTLTALAQLLLHDWADLRRNVALWVMLALPPGLSIVIVRLSETPGGTRADLVPMWVLFAQVMIGIMIFVLNIVDEKEKRTLEALSLTTVSVRGVAVAKMLFVLVLSVAGQLLVLVVNDGLVGRLAVLLALLPLGGAVFVALGAVVAAFVETERSAGAVASAVMVVMFLSGVLAQTGGTPLYVTRLLPSGLSITAVEEAMRGGVPVAETVGLAGWLLVLLLVAGSKLRADLRR